MYLKLLKMFTFLLLVIFIFPAGNSFAFKSLTRDQLVYDAIEFCPAELKAYLRYNLATVSSGMHYKERHRRGVNRLIDPYDAEMIYERLIKDLRDRKYDEFNTAHAFGVLACFLSETISPDNFKTPDHLIPETVRYDGYQQIETASVKSDITNLIENYRIPCRARIKKEITDQLYNVAVNEIVDYWVSAWESGGNQAGLFASVGDEITHKNLVLNFKVVG
ncbi:MAG: hypothetical protein P8185_09380 [Deltaproteobacteria bacterium]|jgi:hypothetical protein